MTECFVDYWYSDTCDENCRYSIEDLDEEEGEIELFEQESDIKNECCFILHKGISLNSKAERYKHRKLLQQFEENARKYDSGLMLSHVVDMREFKRIADNIRAVRLPQELDDNFMYEERRHNDE